MASHLKHLVRSATPLLFNAASKATWGITLINEGAPALIQALLNKILKGLPGFEGSMGEMRLGLLGARIEIVDFVLNKKVTRERAQRFLTIPLITVDLKWSQLIRGRLIGDIEIQKPTVLFDFHYWKQIGPTRPDPERRREPATWQAAVQRALPFKIETLRVQDGVVHLRNWNEQALEPLEIQQIQLEIRDVANRPEHPTTPSSLQATARLQSSGKLEWKMQGNFLDEKPLLKSSLKLEDFQLREIQDLIRQYFNVEVNQGSLEVFAEAEVQAGHFTGYAKPIFDHLHIRLAQPPTVWTRFRTWIYRGVLHVLRNKETDRIATRINFEGSLEDPDIHTLAVIGNLLKNAFGSAFRAQLEPHLSDYFQTPPPKGQPPINQSPSQSDTTLMK